MVDVIGTPTTVRTVIIPLAGGLQQARDARLKRALSSMAEMPQLIRQPPGGQILRAHITGFPYLGRGHVTKLSFRMESSCFG